ncbi:hypothetical protein DFH06DRAFT_1300825 [Mycena polygramma]|nr:hypothetical protein DFH06DRAFT_1300825 [Mycena polygramma]
MWWEIEKRRVTVTNGSHGKLGLCPKHTQTTAPNPEKKFRDATPTSHKPARFKSHRVPLRNLVNIHGCRPDHAKGLPYAKSDPPPFKSDKFQIRVDFEHDLEEGNPASSNSTVVFRHYLNYDVADSARNSPPFVPFWFQTDWEKAPARTSEGDVVVQSWQLGFPVITAIIVVGANQKSFSTTCHHLLEIDPSRLVDELREHIVKLSIEIDVQKELLKKLEHDRSLVQRQLNAVVDPVARLPVEISSEIFLQSLPPVPEPGAPQPLLFLNICHTWTDIALSTPHLWTGIHITSPCADGVKDGLSIWLRRAHNHPLSISLRLRGTTIDLDVSRFIWSEDRQLKHLEICHQGRSTKAIIDGDNGMIDFFGGITPGSLPLLETLAIRGPKTFKEGSPCSGSQIFELLCRAPNLCEFILEDMPSITSIPSTTEIVVLPTLRRLMFGECGRSPDSNDKLFDYLSLPALEALSLPLMFQTTLNLLSFLQRSSPPLRELVLGDGLEDDSSSCTHPHMSRVVGAKSPDWHQIIHRVGRFPIVTSQPTHSCPLPLRLVGIPYSAWKKLLEVFSLRRATLRILYVELSGSPQPAVDILAGFRELEADGIQIYIGDNTSVSD